VAGWVEFILLRHSLNRRIGSTGLPAVLVARLWASALIAAAAAWAVKLLVPSAHPVVQAVAVLGVYGTTFLAATLLLGVAEARGALARVMRRRRQSEHGQG
jgi:putative peptidoglycan lipid II flippase